MEIELADHGRSGGLDYWPSEDEGGSAFLVQHVLQLLLDGRLRLAVRVMHVVKMKRMWAPH